VTWSLSLGLGSFNGNYQNAGRTKSFPRTLAGKRFVFFFFLVLFSSFSRLSEEQKELAERAAQVPTKPQRPSEA